MPPRFWQSRFYDFNVWTAEKRIEKLRRMHRNPVKRGLVWSYGAGAASVTTPAANQGRSPSTPCFHCMGRQRKTPRRRIASVRSGPGSASSQTSCACLGHPDCLCHPPADRCYLGHPRGATSFDDVMAGRPTLSSVASFELLATAARAGLISPYCFSVERHQFASELTS